jgi:histone H3/H4
MRSFKLLPLFVLLLIASYDATIAQGKSIKSRKPISVPPSSAASSSEDDYTKGLREVLLNGTLSAVKELGRDGGFLKNLRVKIPMPKPLQPVEKTMRFIGQGRVADDFIAAMNHAAERAVPAAIDVFKDAARQMTFNDARQIVKGPDDAATQFFRRTSEKRLAEKFLPIVRKFTEQVGVTAQYKRLMEQAGPVANLAGRDTIDLDQYVTQKALDGLFLLMADEERRIRKDPVARTSEILRTIFGIGRH